MIELLIVLGYLIVGLVAAKRVFAVTLGTADRYKKREHYDVSDYWTKEFTAAVWWALGALIAWPLLAPLRVYVFAPTIHERDRINKARVQEAERIISTYSETNRSLPM